MRKVFALIILIALSGCVPPSPPPSVVVTGPEADYQKAALSVKEKRYHEAIAAYRKIAADAPQSPVAADALFEAAYLQTFYENAQKDYAQALQGFEDFLKRYPGHLKAAEARNWRVVLKTILDARKENDRLNRSIEELKQLDIRHEERRRK
jgi:outer membrane protein assembly factor BamD (BamD/ComL family)